ncbi:MAG TPA: uridine diphosphate-N-acetylglucosamine-binding protein YvcK [Pyrinomonadaceae bacterium]|nr:uridine diphosphate-N-acetylglucosamine-binding protein YvcK [Pyrinomonadaceae bacterium]
MIYQNDLQIPKRSNVVAIGGGTGLSTLLSGLKHYVGAGEEFSLNDLSAIVTVSDDGGSSGRLRDELQMLPPGDIRNCMVALSEDSNLLSRLFQHRFKCNGDLGGHSFGNLFLAALSEISGGDFVEAVRLSSEVLAIKGTIFPATDCDVRLVAEMENGTIVRGESNITGAHSVIKRLRLEPQRCSPLPEAIQAITAADIITVGPGSLFTSLLPPLLVEDVAEAIAASSAIKIFICNLMTQPGETDNFTSGQHLEKIKEYAPEIDFDFVVVNSRPISAVQTARYASEGAHQIGLGDSLSPVLRGKSVELVRAELLDEGEKVRHNPEKLAQVVLDCALKAEVEFAAY